MKNPLYKTLATQFTEAIQKGEYAVGDYLPKEIEICEKFGMSRATVRAAISILENQGLVSRKKKAGTRVESNGQNRSYNYDLSSLVDLANLAEVHVRKILSVEPIIIDKILAKTYDLPVGEHFFELESVRLASATSDQIFSYSKLYFSNIYEDAIPSIQQQSSKLMAVLLEEYSSKPIVQIEQTLQCVKLNQRVKSVFGKLENSNDSYLCITRKYYSYNQELLLVSYSIHSEQDFSYKITLSSKL
nr:GntR family transcriptional regulator [Acinetobacter oleivorans]